jgi:hypothetical protein
LCHSKFERDEKMTRVEIMNLAREAGIDWHKHWDDEENRLERFVKLVEKSIYEKNMFAEAYAYGYTEGATDERKACAKLCEIEADEYGTDTNEWYVARACAVLIHSRDE